MDKQLRDLLAHQDGTRAGTDPEELHQFRVAIRRLRSLLKTTSMFGDAGDAVRDELRWLGAVTGPVRDLDVLLLRLRDDLAGFGPEDQAAAAELLSVLRSERAQAHRVLGRALSSARYADLLRAVAALAMSSEHDDEIRSTDLPGTKLIASVRKPYRKLARAVGALPEDPPDDDLHALRIQGKRLRYAAETAMPSVRKKEGKQLKSVIKASRTLQDVLGEHQDAVSASTRVIDLVGRLNGADARVAFVAGRIVEREHARRAKVRAEWPEIWHRISDSAAALL